MTQEDHILHGHHCENLKSSLNTVLSEKVLGGNYVVIWDGYNGQQPQRLRKTGMEYIDFILTFASLQ
jgi:hypothetical protein